MKYHACMLHVYRMYDMIYSYIGLLMRNLLFNCQRANQHPNPHPHARARGSSVRAPLQPYVTSLLCKCKCNQIKSYQSNTLVSLHNSYANRAVSSVIGLSITDHTSPTSPSRLLTSTRTTTWELNSLGTLRSLNAYGSSRFDKTSSPMIRSPQQYWICLTQAVTTT